MLPTNSNPKCQDLPKNVHLGSTAPLNEFPTIQLENRDQYCLFRILPFGLTPFGTGFAPSFPYYFNCIWDIKEPMVCAPEGTRIHIIKPCSHLISAFAIFFELSCQRRKYHCSGSALSWPWLEFVYFSSRSNVKEMGFGTQASANRNRVVYSKPLCTIHSWSSGFHLLSLNTLWRNTVQDPRVHKQVIVFFPSVFFHQEQKVYGVNQYDRPFVLVCFLCIKECEVAGTANCGNFTEMLNINIIRFRKVYNISFKFMRTVWSNNYLNNLFIPRWPVSDISRKCVVSQKSLYTLKFRPHYLP